MGEWKQKPFFVRVYNVLSIEIPLFLGVMYVVEACVPVCFYTCNSIYKLLLPAFYQT